MGLKGRELFSSPLHSWFSSGDFGPTDLTNTCSVCTRRVFGGTGIQPRPSGMESDALTTRLPTAQKETQRYPRRDCTFSVKWFPSHVDLEGNEIADTLAKAGACVVPEQSAPLTIFEIFFRTKHQNKTAWITPAYHWYQCFRPGGSLTHGFTRQDQTLLARFRSGRIKTMKFSEGCKSFEMCTNCSSEPATPAHLLECLRLTI
ncbi:RNase H domain-containing protein [Trichonephila clavipes]|uniref:RNase H domain-containing protein n=1 Tax=Trichonephila clavipes TaxID=2585209 RepID=A0A8X6S8A6_TRICX|nr:RNase H domain-containing protein [Trichonephila clavipes]